MKIEDLLMSLRSVLFKSEYILSQIFCIKSKEILFKELKIWQSAIEIANDLFDIADDLDKRRLYRWAERLRASGMLMSNNIAEGSGSSSKKDFGNYLNIAHRSTFENANALILFEMRGIIGQDQLDELLTRLDVLCRQITNCRKSLK